MLIVLSVRHRETPEVCNYREQPKPEAKSSAAHQGLTPARRGRARATLQPSSTTPRTGSLSEDEGTDVLWGRNTPPCTRGLKESAGWSGGSCPSSGHAPHGPTVRPAGHVSQAHGGGFTAQQNAEEACGHQDAGLGLHSVNQLALLSRGATSLSPLPQEESRVPWERKQAPRGQSQVKGSSRVRAEHHRQLLHLHMHLWLSGDTGLACPTRGQAGHQTWGRKADKTLLTPSSHLTEEMGQ